MNYTHKLFEDNAGGLHLAVFDADGTCIYYLCDHDHQFVLRTLADLNAGGDPVADGWEGGEADPSACYAEIAGFVELRNGSAFEVDDDDVC